MGKKAREKRERRESRVDLPMRQVVAAHEEKERRRSEALRRGIDPGVSPAISVPQGMAYHFTPDANGDVHMERLPLARKTYLTTTMLVAFSEQARKLPWCTKALDADTLSRLDPTGHHMIVSAWRHTTEDWTRDNVRAHMMLKLRFQQEAYECMVDMPSRAFGLAIGALTRRNLRDEPEDARGLEGLLLPEGWTDTITEPHWAAGRAFPSIWNAAAGAFSYVAHREAYGDRAIQVMVESGRMTPEQAAAGMREAHTSFAIQTASALRHLGRANLIVAEPEWVQGIGKKPEAAVVAEHAREGRLPFDTIFLDFQGPAGFVPTMPAGRGRAMKLSGALMYRDGDALHVMPYGCVSGTEGEGSPHMLLGRVVLGEGVPGEPGTLRAGRLAMDGKEVGDLLVLDLESAQPGAGVGRVELPLDGEEDPEFAKVWAGYAASAAFRALRVLYMLQGANVELVEAKLHGEGRRRMKRADKRGWPIEVGLMVAVRWKKKLYYRPPGAEVVDANEGRGYSHAFWVGGHPAFYPLGTRIADALADADPDKLVEHPVKGLCRMVWRNPYVKGLHDPHTGEVREPVDKARKVVGNPYEEDQAA